MRQRTYGGVRGRGRKTPPTRSAIKNNLNMNEVFLDVIAEHIAGDPMNPNIRWVKLTRAEISEKMRQLGVFVSRNVVRKLMRKNKLVKRKCSVKEVVEKALIANSNLKTSLQKKKNL